VQRRSHDRPSPSHRASAPLLSPAPSCSRIPLEVVRASSPAGAPATWPSRTCATQARTRAALLAVRRTDCSCPPTQARSWGCSPDWAGAPTHAKQAPLGQGYQFVPGIICPVRGQRVRVAHPLGTHLLLVLLKRHLQIMSNLVHFVLKDQLPLIPSPTVVDERLLTLAGCSLAMGRAG